MKAKSRIMILIFVVVTVVTTMTLFGCTSEKKEGSAERIQVEDTHIFLAPEGDPSTYQLKPLVYPVETASQKVYYRLKDNTDREFLEVSASGVLKAHKLKQDEEGNNIDIFVRIISAEDSDVTLEIKVTIETVAVERISFNPSTINIKIAGAGAQLEPIFYPAHAITGRNLIYTSLNKEVATVDAYGYVTPVGIGQCSIWVQTPKSGAFDTQIESHVTVNVVYTSMITGYRLDLVSDASTLRQVSGDPEGISFVLSQLDPLTDPNPDIIWYINNTTINEPGVQDSKVLTYVPTSLPVGEYHIRAILSNNFETTEPFISESIRIYAPLSSMSGDVLQQKEYAVGDNIMVKVTYGENQYPPEGYKWEIVKPNGDVVEDVIAPNKHYTLIDGSAVYYDLNYEFKEAGNYTIRAEAIVKGKNSGVWCDDIEVSVGEKKPVNDITGIYFDGAHVDQELYSSVIWDALPYAQNYTAQIKLGQDFYDEIANRYDTPAQSGETILPDFTMESGYFGANSFRVPNEIIDSVIGRARDDSDTMMHYSYSIRIKGSNYDEWSDWYSYGGDINAGVEYFDDVIPGMNRYIANMEEYGRLLNYLIVFRPSILTSEDTRYQYELDLIIPFTTEDLDRNLYPVNDGLDTNESTASEIDAVKLFGSVLNSYTESVSLSLDVVSATLGGGETKIMLNVNSITEPTIKTELDPEVDGEYIYGEATSITHYAENPRGQAGTLSIDALNRTMEVATTDQLYLAVEMGYKPVPVAGSRAETIWAEVRKVLNSIISDDMSVNAKALAIYEWLSLNVTYDNKVADSANTLGDAKAYNAFYLEGVFVDHVAVCDGIAKAYGLMCAVEGIPNFKVVGTASGIAHAWNIVLLEDGWYVVDATWSSKKVESSDGQKLEVLNRDYFAVGSIVAKDSRSTYGSYPTLNIESLEYAYTIKISETFDNAINSVGELQYIIEKYLFDKVGQTGDLWIDLVIEEEYFNTNGGNDKERFEAIIEIIQNSVGKVSGISVGCTTDVNPEGEAKIYIHYSRS